MNITPRLKSWKFRDDGNSEWAEIDYRGLKGWLCDCDGDFTEWSLTEVKDEEETKVVGGTVYPSKEDNIYHMDMAVLIIEEIIYHMSGDSLNKLNTQPLDTESK